MGLDTIEISELPYKQDPKLSDNIIIENLEEPEPTSRTTLERVKVGFSGVIGEGNDGFVQGKDIFTITEYLKKGIEKKVDKEDGKGLSANNYTDQEKADLKTAKEKLAALNLADISNTNDIPLWTGEIARLLTIEDHEFNNLRYVCCLVSNEVSDFPEALTESDIGAYIITHRNGQYGFQLVIGQQSGQILTRSQTGNTLSRWAKASEIKLIDSYNSELTDSAPTADAVRRLFLLFSDKITELEMIVKGADISVFPTELLIPAEGGTAELLIKAAPEDEWTITIQ